MLKLSTMLKKKKEKQQHKYNMKLEVKKKKTKKIIILNKTFERNVRSGLQ